MKRTWISILVLAIFSPIILIAASSQNTIGYQGRLNNAAGQPVTGPVTITFAIYGTADGQTPLWSETQSGVGVSNGIFSVRLGDVTTLPSALFNGPDRWLGIRVGADPEMTPRSRLASVAYAFNAQRVGGKKVLMGTGNLNMAVSASSGTANINFGESFAAPPAVTISGLSGQIGTVSFVATELTNVTTTGATVTFRSLTGAPATGSATFSWIAVGE